MANSPIFAFLELEEIILEDGYYANNLTTKKYRE
jgi:hypothetical protein